MKRKFAVAAAIVIVGVLLLVLAAGPYVLIWRSAACSQEFMLTRHERVLLTDVAEKLKVGDIVLFAAAVQMPLSNALTRTYYSHAAIVVREGPAAMISESQSSAGLGIMPSGDGYDFLMAPGVSTNYYLVRAKYYPGATFVMRLAAPLPASSQARLLKYTTEAVGRVKYPSLVDSLGAIALGVPAASRHCFQHVAEAVDYATGSQIRASNGFLDVCRAVCRLPGARLPDGSLYLPPVEVAYNLV
jgi:hypothetical protein